MHKLIIMNKKIKTLVILQRIEEGTLEYFILEGDYTHFDEMIIDCNDHPCEEEFAAMMWDNDGNELIETECNVTFIKDEEWNEIVHISI